MFLQFSEGINIDDQLENEIMGDVDMLHVVTEIDGSEYEEEEKLKLPPKLEITSVIARAAQALFYIIFKIQCKL